MLDIMVDLETMGTAPDSAIVSIGAVAFNPETGEMGGTFYRSILLESSVGEGGKMDASTVEWWLKQSDQARAVFQDPDREEIADVLGAFIDFLWEQVPAGTGLDKVRVWGNGSDFDNVLLSTAYARLNIGLPWKFWNNRCYRTVKNLFPQVKMDRSGTHHNALDDATSQANHLIAIFRVMRGAEGEEEKG